MASLSSRLFRENKHINGLTALEPFPVSRLDTAAEKDRDYFNTLPAKCEITKADRSYISISGREHEIQENERKKILLQTEQDDRRTK